MKLKATLLICLSILFGLQSTLLSSQTTQDYFDIIRPEYSGGLAYETTSFVEKYWRVAGNTGFNETVYLIEKKLKAAGYVLESNAKDSDRFVYGIEERPMKNPTWEPVSAQLSFADSDEVILSQETNRNMVYLNSTSTPKEGVEAEVVYIKDVQDLEKVDVEGKIVFATMSARKIYKDAITKKGAIGLLTYDNPGYLQPEKNSTSIQFRRLRYNKDYPVWGIALSYAAKERMLKELNKGKVSVKVNIQTKLYESTELTVVAHIKGKELPKESLVFSAHIQEPGANDNATGVGAQLEMAVLAAKLVQEGRIEAKRTMTFLWGDEIVSTRRYVEEKEKREAAINWGISLDMVGENTAVTGGSFLIEKMPDPSAIWTRGNDKHSEWGGRVLSVDDMKPHYLNDFIIDVFEAQGKHANWEVNSNPFEGGSDHTPFLRADIPGLLLWHFTDQFYHTDNDRIDKVSKETLKNVGTGALVSGFSLINGDVKFAEQVLNTILITAKERLQAEFELSRTVIKNGGDKSEEVKILETWGTWYDNSIQSVVDVISENDAEFYYEIRKAQKTLDELVTNHISKLNR